MVTLAIRVNEIEASVLLVLNYNCCSFECMGQLKGLEIIIPHRWLSDIDKVLKGKKIGGMSATQIEGRGKVKPYPLQFKEAPELQHQNSYREPLANSLFKCSSLISAKFF